MGSATSIVRLSLESNQYERNLKQAQQSWSEFTKGIGLSVSKFTAVGAAIGAVKGALKVANDAFKSSEEKIDEWGRVIDSSKSLYEGFLTALNTGDISGYLNRIDSIVQAARAAYNELDRLGTMKTIQAPKMSAQQTENERMRMMIQTGRYIAPVDGRRASMQNGQLLTPDQIKRIEQQLQGGMQKVVTLVGNEVAQTGRAIDAVYNRQAQELGMSLKEFRKGTSSMAEFDKRMAGYDQYQKWRAEHTTIDMQSGRETVARGNPFEQFAKWGTFRVDGDRYNDLVKLIQQRDQQAGSLYGMQSQAYRTMNRAEGITLRQLMGGSGGSRISRVSSRATASPDDSIQKFFERMLMKSNSEVANFKANEDTGPSEIWQSITQGADESTDALQRLTDAFEALNAKEGVTASGLKGDAKTTADAWRGAAAAMSSVGSALSQMEDPGAKIMGIIGEAIANIASGFAQASAQEGKGGVWYWIAATAAGLAAMVSTIATIHSATGFAQGGIVQGNTYSSDQIPARLNAGEVVLTHAMAGNLASQLEGNGLGNLNLSATISGEQIRLALNNNGRRTGRGEYVQTNFR